MNDDSSAILVIIYQDQNKESMTDKAGVLALKLTHNSRQQNCRLFYLKKLIPNYRLSQSDTLSATHVYYVRQVCM